MQLCSPWDHNFDGKLELLMETCSPWKIYRVQLPSHSHALFFQVMKHVGRTYADLLEDTGDVSDQLCFGFLHEQKRKIAKPYNFSEESLGKVFIP